MEYSGKYAVMAEELRADGCDERTVERFVREEMEADEWRSRSGVTDFEALREWNGLPNRDRQILLNTAYCRECGMTSFAPGYDIRRARFGLVVEGSCATCGARISRMHEDV